MSHAVCNELSHFSHRLIVIDDYLHQLTGRFELTSICKIIEKSFM